MGGVSALDPLSYPGRMIGEPALLSGSEVLPMTVTGSRVGHWRVPDAESPDAATEESLDAGLAELLDAMLESLGQLPAGDRHPVIAIGCNAAPEQLHYKLTRLGLPPVVPMTPMSVSGLGIGVSGHVALNGYVANSPYVDPDSDSGTQVVVTFLDTDQLRAVDDTELPRYRRVLLSGAEYPMVLPSGERLDGAYLYADPAGVLAGVDGKPLTPTAQPALLAALLERSAELRALFASPQDWVDKCRADVELRLAAKQIFYESGWVLPQEDLLHGDSSRPALTYDDLSPLATSRDHP